MPSHMSTIGVPVTSSEDFNAVGNLTFERGEQVECSRGTYHRLAMGDGAELWAFTDWEGNAHALSPHFDATTRFQVELTDRIVTPEYLFEGGFHGWAEPDGEGAGVFPFVFDAPDFLTYEGLQFPVRCEVALSAFAHELSLFTDEDEFAAAKRELNLAPESFIPSGLFTSEEQPVAAAFAIFAGSILAWRRCWNELTSEPFAWLRVKTLGGEVDVVCDFDLLHREPVVGGIVEGSFWLSGRVRPVQ